MFAFINVCFIVQNINNFPLPFVYCCKKICFGFLEHQQAGNILFEKNAFVYIYFKTAYTSYDNKNTIFLRKIFFAAINGCRHCLLHQYMALWSTGQLLWASPTRWSGHIRHGRFLSGLANCLVKQSFHVGRLRNHFLWLHCSWV